MPEGPEVKSRADVLRKYIVGWKIEKIITDKNLVLPCVSVIVDIETHGKLTFIITNDFVVKVHYMMEGNLVFKKGNHSDTCFVLTSGLLQLPLYFDDQRKFGTIHIIQNPEKIGYDHLNPTIPENQALEQYISTAKKSKNEICKFLLNQEHNPGVGNYLKSEILFEIKIHPQEITKNIPEFILKEIFFATKEIMWKSYSNQGCSLRTYENSLNEKGNFSSFLKVYSRKSVNGFAVLRDVFSDARTTHWCPDIQKFL